MKEKSLERMVAPQFERLGSPVSPALFDRLTASDRPWHEDAAAVDAGLRRGRERARRLVWVRAQILFRLTPVERRCIELYFFEGLNYRAAAAQLGVNATSVYRAVQRGIRKLRIRGAREPARAPASAEAAQAPLALTGCHD